MLAVAPTSPDFPAPPVALYDFHVGPAGIRLSPTCAQGHAYVLELCDRLSLQSALPASNGWGLTEALLERILKNADGSGKVTEQSAGASGSNTVCTAPTPASDPAAVIGGMTLGKLRDIHMANLARGPKKATPATRDRGYAINLLIETVGDRPLAELTPDDASTFADLLAAWPARRQHYPQLANLSAPAVAARAKREGLPPIGLGTQHKHLMHINALMNYAIKSGQLAASPFRFLDTARYIKQGKGSRRKKKDIFHHADLMQIFDRKHLASYNAPHKYWVPLIGYFTGMRVNEIAQLSLADVRTDPYFDETGEEQQVMTFEISDDREGQSVKTNYSIRRIPVPQAILDLGFERYLDDVRASGASLLFPGLPWREGGPGQTVSVWFNGTHLRKVCGITSPRKTLHCLRHNLTTLMERSNVPDSIVCAINGHSTGVTVDKRSYVAEGSVFECKRVLNTLPFPKLDLEPYVSERFAGYLAHEAAERASKERAKAEGRAFKRRMGPRRNVPGDAFGSTVS